MRLLVVLFVSVGLALAIAAGTFAYWMSSAENANDSIEIWLWLPVRWLVGLVAPLIFGLMAYSAAKIRSTQSATGILYVAAVCAILGELVGVLLGATDGVASVEYRKRSRVRLEYCHPMPGLRNARPSQAAPFGSVELRRVRPYD